MRKCEGRLASPKLRIPRHKQSKGWRKCGQVDGSGHRSEADAGFILQATKLLRSELGRAELGRALLMEISYFRVDSGREGLRWKPVMEPQG